MCVSERKYCLHYSKLDFEAFDSPAIHCQLGLRPFYTNVSVRVGVARGECRLAFETFASPLSKLSRFGGC